MILLYIKALHIIFVVTWFSGMFYLGRLFIYNCEAMDKPVLERAILQQHFGVMMHRLYWAITLPSAVLTLLLGVALATFYWPFSTWLWLKVLFVVFLYAYQYSLHTILAQQKSGIFNYSSQQLRLWKEVPTVLLVAIVIIQRINL